MNKPIFTPEAIKESVFLPKTQFPMKANLPQKEKELLDKWNKNNFSKALKKNNKANFVLHDGPPFANGNIHMGTALNKVLKDIVVRSRVKLGYSVSFIPGWDCHGLPIEQKVEEKLKEQKIDKNSLSVKEFRRLCSDFANNWVNKQRDSFKRLGIMADWDKPYLTMDYESEALIVNELHKFADNGLLYRSTKPVMWSVVEQTALAEAEVEYKPYKSDAVWVKFYVPTAKAFIVIWTTTPWTLPANRAINFNDKIQYSIVEMTHPEFSFDKEAAETTTTERYIVANATIDSLAKTIQATKVNIVSGFTPKMGIFAQHPLVSKGYDFKVPLLKADYVTDDSGTGFVHCAPGHGRDDYNTFMDHIGFLEESDISTVIPELIDAYSVYNEKVIGFEGKKVLNADGTKGDANKAVMAALVETKSLLMHQLYEHSYAHSWRSKKPIIYRNTPQWFIAVDRQISNFGDSLRNLSLQALTKVKFNPSGSVQRLTSMIEERPDWVISRQRLWGVPIAVFVNIKTKQVLVDKIINQRIVEHFKESGASVWFEPEFKTMVLKDYYNPNDYEQVFDIVDVWFESGSTHAFVLEHKDNRLHPADLYLEGSDQHRGWFQSSLLESVGTRGIAPYKQLLTTGFVVDAKGYKMSKSIGNVIDPIDITDKYGADILRLWTASSDYFMDLKISDPILQSHSEVYRKIRNTLRFMIGCLEGQKQVNINYLDLPDLEKWILHQLYVTNMDIIDSYENFTFHRVVATIVQFINKHLSSVYFDIRKDTIYCEGDSKERRATFATLKIIFDFMCHWLSPILCFTTDEAWGYLNHSNLMELENPTPDKLWHNVDIHKRFEDAFNVRKMVLSYLEKLRNDNKIQSNLETHVKIATHNVNQYESLKHINWEQFLIISQAELIYVENFAQLEKNEDFINQGIIEGDIAILCSNPLGHKCGRCWQIKPEVQETGHLCNRCSKVMETNINITHT